MQDCRISNALAMEILQSSTKSSIYPISVKMKIVQYLGISIMQILQCGTVTTRSIFTYIITKTPHSSPVRAIYGVSVVSSTTE